MFIILLVAGNTMAQSIRERTNELGVLKTIGFGDGRDAGAGPARVVLHRDRRRRPRPGVRLAHHRAGDPTDGLLPIFYFPHEIWFSASCSSSARPRHRIPAGVQASRLRIVDALRRTG